MKKSQLILGLVAVAAIVALVVWGRDKIHFDFGAFRAQLAMVDWSRIAIAAGMHLRRLPFSGGTLGMPAAPQQAGSSFFAAGNAGDRIYGGGAYRPCRRSCAAVPRSKKTGLPLSNQIAVYVVERLFDAGTTALLFSSAILLTTWFGAAGALPHPELVKKAGYWGMALTLAGTLFLVAVRLAGGAVAAFLEGTLGVLSKKIGQAVGDKIRGFREGLDAIRSFSDFGLALLTSLGMWLLIAAAYLETAKAFVASPELASMTAAKCILLMVVSGVTSIFQLPILGWFTQIGLVAAAISSFFGVPPEAADGLRRDAADCHLPERDSCGSYLGAGGPHKPAQGHGGE